MHLLLRPAPERPDPGLRPGLPDRVDPVRRRSTSCDGGAASGSSSCTARGVTEARLYGAEKEIGGLNAFYLLTDKPEAYGLPNAENAVLPSRNNVRGYLGSLVTAVLGVVGAVFAFRDRGGSGRGKE